MSYSMCYQAIPATSRLFRNLRTDRRWTLILLGRFHHGVRPFDFWTSEESTLVNDAIDAVSELGTFPSVADFFEALEVVKPDVREAEIKSPELLDRTAFLCNDLQKIQDQLVGSLREAGRSEAAELVSDLLFGDRSLSPEIFGMREEQFGLITSTAVARFAEILHGLEPQVLFPVDGYEDCRHEYSGLRNLYSQAAERGEAIILAGC